MSLFLDNSTADNASDNRIFALPCQYFRPLSSKTTKINFYDNLMKSAKFFAGSELFIVF